MTDCDCELRADVVGTPFTGSQRYASPHTAKLVLSQRTSKRMPGIC